MENKIINEKLIFLDLELVRKKEVIEWIARVAEESGYVSDQAAFVEAVLKREEEVPTAIGHNIAIPHGKSSVVQKPFIAFLRSKEVFKWTDGHEDDVQLIFLIGVPSIGTEKLHLKFISQVSKKLLDEEFRQKLATFNNKTHIFELLCSIDIKEEV